MDPRKAPYPNVGGDARGWIANQTQVHCVQLTHLGFLARPGFSNGQAYARHVSRVGPPECGILEPSRRI